MKRSTLVAALVLFSLAGYLFWLERHGGEDTEIDTVFDVGKEDITRIEIRHEGREGHDEKSVTLERDTDRWRIVAPVEADVDESEVNLLLDNIATMSITRTIPREPPDGEATGLEAFGLDRPKLELRFETTDGVEHGLLFGKDTLTPESQYALRLDSKDVLVVASYLSNNFDKTAWDLRDKAIFHVDDEAEAKRISIARGDETIELVNESGLWRLTTPVALANRFEATAIASRIQRAEMVDLVAESATELEPYGLDPPAIVVRIELEDPDAPPMELEVGGVDKLDYYARVPSRPQVFLIERGLAEDLQKKASDFLSKKLFEASAFQITRLQIGERVVERTSRDEKDVWVEDGETRDERAVEALLEKLTETDAERIVEHVSALEPSTVITIWTDQTKEQISVSASEDEKVYVQRKGDDIALRLGAETWSEISSLLSLEPKTEE